MVDANVALWEKAEYGSTKTIEHVSHSIGGVDMSSAAAHAKTKVTCCFMECN
jgi:hypothetical protein